MTVSSKSATGHDMSRSQQAAEFKPCMWKLLVVTACILIAAFIAMETVDDTYTGPFETKVSATRGAEAG